MRRAFFATAFFLVGAVSARADPVAFGTLPPRPDELLALVFEVCVVTTLLRRFKLRQVRFFVAWYAVNLLTFYGLLRGVIELSSVFVKNGSVFLIGEGAVFVVEAAALVWLSRLSFLKSEATKPVTPLWAILASAIGNLASIVSFFAIVASEESLQRLIHRK